MLWTLDIEVPSVCRSGRHISLIKKLMSCGTVSCLKISMASMMRLVCHELIGMMGCLPVLDVGVIDNG